MSYIVAIKTAVFTFPILAFLFTIPFILNQYHKYGAIHYFRVLIIYSFILYLITAYFLVILPLPTFEEVANMTGPTMQLIPFAFIGDIIENANEITNFNTFINFFKNSSVYVVLFNIVLTIPFGMYLRYYFKCSLKKTFFLSFLLSLFFELTQLSGLYFIYPRAYRLFDVDDLILNTLGGVLGYFILGLFKGILPSREKIDEESLIKGTKVSGLRRITLFFLDIFLYFVLVIFVSIFVKDYPFIITAIIYYVIIPTIWKGKTIGSKFLNVRITYNRFNFIKNILRLAFIYLYYFQLPIILVVFAMSIVSHFNLSNYFTIFVYLSVFLFICFFYLINIILILKNRTIFYDKIFKTKYESTISIPDSKENEIEEETIDVNKKEDKSEGN